jgi:hypothetical protein
MSNLHKAFRLVAALEPVPGGGGIPGLVQLEIEQVEHRFPPPWSVDELEACFVVKDSSGQKLAYVYYEEEPGRRSQLSC